MKSLKLVFISLLTFALIGCGRPLHRNFYMLNYTPNAFENRRLGAKNAHPATLRLRTFEIETAYARQNIVFRESPFRFDFYPDHLWAIRPNEMISDLVFRHLEDIGLVENVVRRLDERAPDFELTGTVLAIEEINEGEGGANWFAHLRIAFALTDFRANETIYNRVFSEKIPVAEHSPLSVVKSMSIAMKNIANALIFDLDNAIYKHLNP